MPIEALGQVAIDLAESGRIPDVLLRGAIRRMCAQRLREDVPDDPQQAMVRTQAFLESMRRGPVAPSPERANDQHYEVPAAFFEEVLGPHRKYSCCYWSPSCRSLEAAEQESLRRTVEHAQLADGQRILELGCGWGSLTLWMARQFPQSRITAVSNSASQREFIEQQARRQGSDNVEVITADMNDFSTSDQFDRVVSIEMFEHMRNYEELLGRIARWLAPLGCLMIHIFCHRRVPYEYDTVGADNWMGRYFFSGGIMPSDDLLLRCRSPLAVEAQWRWPGIHYERTANAWLANLDARRERVDALMTQAYGSRDADVWRQRWRMFFMACAELFGYDGGRQWWVSHYRLVRR